MYVLYRGNVCLTIVKIQVTRKLYSRNIDLFTCQHVHTAKKT